MQLPSFRFVKKLGWKNFFKRVLLVFVAASIVYGGYYFLIKKPSLNPQTPVSKASLRASLNEHLLALTALREIDTNDRSTVYKLEGVRSTIDTSLNNYRNEVTKYQEVSQDLNTIDLESFVENEQSLLSAYDGNYQLLGNASNYSLSQDIGFINPETDQQEITTRTGITLTSLSDVKNAQPVSLSSKEGLNQAMSCIENINRNPPDNASSLSKVIAKCDRIFNKSRSLILADLLRPLNTSDASKIYKDISQLIDKIQT